MESLGVEVKKVLISPGARLLCETPARFTYIRFRSSIEVGAYTYFRGGEVTKLDSIGRYCSVGPGFMAGDASHPSNWLSTSPFQYSNNKFGFSPTADGFHYEKRDPSNDPTMERGRQQSAMTYGSGRM